MKKIEFTPELIRECVEKLIPEDELTPLTVGRAMKLPSFYSRLKACEEMYGTKYAALDSNLQSALVFRRLQQLFNIAWINPIWRRVFTDGGVCQTPCSMEEWQEIPISDKNSIRDFYTESRAGVVMPMHPGGFEIVASGGTSDGTPSETVYSLKELSHTYELAGDFIGNYMLNHYMTDFEPKWLITTLADYQMWSSGTMVGGVLQKVPGVNYIGAGPVAPAVFQRMMSYEGQKALMGISQGIAILSELGKGLGEKERASFRVAMYGSGVLSDKQRAELKDMYPNLSFLSYFAATQAEAIGLQLDAEKPYLASVPGLHLIEIVDKKGKWVKEGEEGELVVTRLHATEAPVFRFRIGDRMIRRPAIDTDLLKTSQFEFAGRSSDVIHIADTQYPAGLVFEAICKQFAKYRLFDLKAVADEYQFVNARSVRRLTLLVAVDMPSAAQGALIYMGGGRMLFMNGLIDALSVFNRGEANQYSLEKTNYQFDIRFVAKKSSEIFRTEVGKTPLLKDIL